MIFFWLYVTVIQNHAQCKGRIDMKHFDPWIVLSYCTRDQRVILYMSTISVMIKVLKPFDKFAYGNHPTKSRGSHVSAHYYEETAMLKVKS